MWKTYQGERLIRGLPGKDWTSCQAIRWPQNTEVLMSVILFSLTAESWKKTGYKSNTIPSSPKPKSQPSLLPFSRRTFLQWPILNSSNFSHLSPGSLHCLLADLSDYSLTPIQVLLCCRVTFFYFASCQIYLYLFINWKCPTEPKLSYILECVQKRS